MRRGLYNYKIHVSRNAFKENRSDVNCSIKIKLFFIKIGWSFMLILIAILFSELWGSKKIVVPVSMNLRLIFTI